MAIVTLSRWSLNILSLLLTINYSFGQDNKRLKAGVNIMGVAVNTIDAEFQYEITNNISFTLSGGRQFNAKVPDLIHTENSVASGNFIRAGSILLTGKPEDKARFFIKAEFIYATLEHSTNITFIDFYETFTVPYYHKSNRNGVSVGLGVAPKLSKRLELDFYFASSHTKGIEAFMLDGYPLPGFYVGQKILSTRETANVYFKICFILKYKFNSFQNISIN